MLYVGQKLSFHKKMRTRETARWVKELAKSDDLSLIPMTHITAEENRALKVVF